jgi:molybdopterin adenylyltransferase
MLTRGLIMGSKEHKKHAVTGIRFGIVTISDTRTKETDTSGSLIQTLIRDANHLVGHYSIIPDDRDSIAELLSHLIRDDSLDAIILSGGTGVSTRDITPETVRPLLEKELPGFGELFRFLSMEEIGSAAMMSRAIAGITNGKAIFCIPGSRGAVSLAMNRLILEETGHMLYEVRK